MTRLWWAKAAIGALAANSHFVLPLRTTKINRTNGIFHGIHSELPPASRGLRPDLLDADAELAGLVDDILGDARSRCCDQPLGHGV